MRDTHPSRARSAAKSTKSTYATNPEGMTEITEHSVPCVNATYYEISRGLHAAAEGSDTCLQCDITLNIFNQRRMENEAAAEREPVI